MKFLLFFAFCFVLSPSVDLHDYHISQCSIDYNESEKAIEVTMHIYIDDLEDALDALNVEPVFIGAQNELEQSDDYIAQYINQSLVLTVNDEVSTLIFVGKELTSDLVAIWCYLEITNVENLKSLKVKNDLLMEIFPDQKNIVQISGPNDQDGYFLMKDGDSEDIVIFD